ncbi:MAG: metal-dependent hydrolase [Balneolaceae bacterium]|nr:MAG: metal-dependent hydrolase [Balneolaceae bacterium]
MDPLAHTLFGATMAEAGLKRKTALATATLIIGANIPDVDAVAMLISSDYALQVRRGWTHGILALMIWPFLLTGAMLGVDRLLQRWRSRSGRRDRAPSASTRNRNPNFPSTSSHSPPMRPVTLLGIAFLGVWSHPLLDWLNTYGIRLLMPFNDTWFYGDTLFIIDPWIWLLAGAGVVLARSESWPGIGGWIVLGTALTALVVSADMVPWAAKIVWMAGVAAIVLVRWTGRHRHSAQPIAFGLLMATVLYVAVMFAGARLTSMHARSHLSADGVEVRQVMANPLPARPLMRTGVAASPTHYYLFEVNWMRPGSFELTWDPVPLEPPDRIAEAALRSPDLQGFRNWLRFPVYEVRRLDDGWRVYIRDLRFVYPEQQTSPGIGMAVVDLDEELQVRRVR